MQIVMLNNLSLIQLRVFYLLVPPVGTFLFFNFLSVLLAPTDMMVQVGLLLGIGGLAILIFLSARKKEKKSVILLLSIAYIVLWAISIPFVFFLGLGLGIGF